MRTSTTGLWGNRIKLQHGMQWDLHLTFQDCLCQVQFSEMVVKVGQGSYLKAAENSTFLWLGRKQFSRLATSLSCLQQGDSIEHKRRLGLWPDTRSVQAVTDARWCVNNYNWLQNGLSPLYLLAPISMPPARPIVASDWLWPIESGRKDGGQAPSLGLKSPVCFGRFWSQYCRKRKGMDACLFSTYLISGI